MRQRLRAIRRSESGFTLTELLIVIVILGVLTGIVVFAVGAFSDRGEVAACKADVKTVQVAVEAYRAKTGALPATVAVLVPDYLKQAPPAAEADAAKYWVIYTVAGGGVAGKLDGGADC